MDDHDRAAIPAVAQWVSGVLRDRIVKGIHPPGARLIERKISAELNVSRTPVREALKLLQADGLIEISRNKGAQVVQYDAQDAITLFEVLAALERLAAEKLATTITEGVLDDMETLHAKMIDHHRKKRVIEYFDINSMIHDMIVENCGNPLLNLTHKRLIARARQGRFKAILNPGRLRQAVDEHEALMVALRQKDSESAGRIWETHLLNTGRTVADFLLLENPRPEVTPA